MNYDKLENRELDRLVAIKLGWRNVEWKTRKRGNVLRGVPPNKLFGRKAVPEYSVFINESLIESICAMGMEVHIERDITTRKRRDGRETIEPHTLTSTLKYNGNTYTKCGMYYASDIPRIICVLMLEALEVKW